MIDVRRLAVLREVARHGSFNRAAAALRLTPSAVSQQISALERGLGVWDVYGSCEREGSLDSAIRDAVVNDIASLHLPKLVAVAHNGGESFRHARHTRTLGVPVHRLPSSSPANASWSFERKVQAWREVFERYLVIP